MKSWFWSMFIVYALFMAFDWISVSRNATPEWCQHWMKQTPWYGHLAMPGFGNGCIDILLRGKK